MEVDLNCELDTILNIVPLLCRVELKSSKKGSNCQKITKTFRLNHKKIQVYTLRSFHNPIFWLCYKNSPILNFWFSKIFSSNQNAYNLKNIILCISCDNQMSRIQIQKLMECRDEKHQSHLFTNFFKDMEEDICIFACV